MSDAEVPVNVRRLAVLCGACKPGLHSRCWDRLGDQPAPCPCGCWDDGIMTRAALLDQMRRQPVALAMHVQFTAAFERSNTLDLHMQRLARRAR